MRQFIKFVSVGAVGTTGHYLTLLVFVHIFSVGPVISSSIGFVVGASINYILNYLYTFKSEKNHVETMTKFFTVAAFGAGLNGTIMYVGTVETNLHYFIVQIFATGVVVFLTYIMNRLWTFSN